MKRKHKGAHSELLACAQLLENDYEVFRNVSPHGIIDIIAFKTDEIIKFTQGKGIEAFDVKSRETNAEASSLKLEQEGYGIQLLVVMPNKEFVTIKNPRVVGMEKEIICSECKKVFIAKGPRTRVSTRNHFCSDKCSSAFGQRKFKERHRHA